MHRALRLKTPLQWDKKPQNQAWSTAEWELAGVLYRKLEYGLTGKELAAFTTGRLVGVWDKTDVLNTRLKTLTPELEKQILASITALSTDGVLPVEILQEIERYQKSDDPSLIYDTPNKVYNFVRRMILHQEMGITQPKRAA
jgi:hypothetical protein